jgi:DNA-binding MarR family transcriptional regulator
MKTEAIPLERRRKRASRKTKPFAHSRTAQGNGRDKSETTEWDDLVAVKLIQIAEIISRGASQVYESGYGIRNTELRILLQLGGGRQLSVNEISRRTRVDKAWISRSLEVMKRAGLVQRVRHSTDTRKNLVSLSDKGEQLLHTIKPIALTRNRHLLAGLRESEVHQMLDLLRERAEQLLLPEMDKRRAGKRRRKSVMVPTY